MGNDRARKPIEFQCQAAGVVGWHHSRLPCALDYGNRWNRGGLRHRQCIGCSVIRRFQGWALGIRSRLLVDSAIHRHLAPHRTILRPKAKELDWNGSKQSSLRSNRKKVGNRETLGYSLSYSRYASYRCIWISCGPFGSSGGTPSRCSHNRPGHYDLNLPIIGGRSILLHSTGSSENGLPAPSAPRGERPRMEAHSGDFHFCYISDADFLGWRRSVLSDRYIGIFPLAKARNAAIAMPWSVHRTPYPDVKIEPSVRQAPQEERTRSFMRHPTITAAPRSLTGAALLRILAAIRRG